MTQLHELLDRAAPSLTRPLDLVDLERRARQRGLRRLLACVTAGLAAIGGVAVAPGTALFASGDHGQRVETADVEEPSIDAPVDHGPNRGEDAPVGRSDNHASGSVADAIAPRATSDHPRPPATTSATTTTTTPSTEPHPAAAASCAVHGDALTDYGQQSCRFTATAPGGWNVDGGDVPSDRRRVATVNVTRDGVTTTYRSRQVSDPTSTGFFRVQGCADGIIEPGDLVEVIIELQQEWIYPQSTMGAGAGEHWGCSDPGP